jgi:hypothetical protein
MTPVQQREDILTLILWYEVRGYDWLDVVTFLMAYRAGMWPPR